MTPETLAACTGATMRVAADFAPLIDSAMLEFDISTPARQAAFLAQVGHESGGLKWLTELWGPTPAQERYEGRKDLGNVNAGDGLKFRGRGLIQVTGRANYRACGAALGFDAESFPLLMSDPGPACRSAAWFFQKHGCNELADDGLFTTITKRINGGLNGLDERLKLWAKAKTALGVIHYA